MALKKSAVFNRFPQMRSHGMEKRNVVEDGRTCCTKCGRVKSGSGPVQSDWLCPHCKWGDTKQASDDRSVGAAAEEAASLHKVT